ncbi:hypothetical protein [Flagellimonas pacifica]|uniref:Adhesin domain-containing protein n=1 Tax=Flagellimonas pacifica TaxID=1247520 RepID=A0A285ME31_9FLAO|nr:hypothetical protein [Allomuricauda parva]SNY95444.1 hypothetical protein SAMN06265377_1113 [Allomuricauda parva]
MKGIYYKNTVLTVLLGFLTLTVFAQSERSKKWEKSYDLSATGTVQIENKYGNVVINGWDKEELKVSIAIKVTHRKDENAKKLLDRIQPEVTLAGDFVRVTSEIVDRSSSVFSRYFNKANPFDFDKSNIQIDYEVYLPINAELGVINKFGDVIISTWNGDLDANVQHGDVWVNEDISTAKIDMRFGKLNSRRMGYGNIKMSNGSIDMENAQKLKIISSGSNIKLNEVSNLELYSSKDEVSLATIGSLRGDFKFSDVDIATIENEMFLTLRIAEVEIHEILKSDAEIDIVQESSEINIDISGLAFKFRATLEQGLLRVPKSFDNIETNVTNAGRKIRDITANYGNGARGEFSINGIKGVIVLTD